MQTDTSVNNLVINKLTKAQYDAIQSPSATELYLVPDEVDTAPTSGSSNCVTSGGVYTALSGKVSSLAVTQIIEISQSAYDALATKDSSTLYLITS